MKKPLLLLLSIAIASIFLFLYIDYKRHIKYIDYLNNDAEKLTSSLNTYFLDYYDVPKNNFALNQMFEWINKTSGIAFEKDQYAVCYDSINKISSIYTFGKDKHDDKMLFTPFNKPNYKKSLGKLDIKKSAVLDFFINYFKNKDIVLMNLKPLEFNCNDIIYGSETNPFLFFKLYQGITNVWNDKENKKKFLQLISHFEREHFNYDKKKYSKGNEVFVKYKNGVVSVVCANNLSEQQVEILTKELENFYKKRKESLFFDYAIFSVTTKW